MSRGVKRKWRPPLALVIGGTLGAVLALPIIGLTWLRLAGNILGWLETAQLIGAISVVATLVLAVLLWRLVLRPVWALTRHARDMKAGRTDVAPPTRFGTHELGKLGQSVIEMGDALNARARSLSAYADHVTHELKSPLTSLQGAAEVLKDPTLPQEDRLELLNTIHISAARMEQLLNELRAHAAARLEAAPGETRVSDALPSIDGLGVQLLQDGTLPMSGADLMRVLTQLLSNAAEHGATQVSLTAGDDGLTVTDDGTGVAAGDEARIFDPFFTSKRDSGGTGMGLSIARTLVEAAGGRLDLVASAQGATFRLQF